MKVKITPNTIAINGFNTRLNNINEKNNMANPPEIIKALLAVKLPYINTANAIRLKMLLKQIILKSLLITNILKPFEKRNY